MTRPLAPLLAALVAGGALLQGQFPAGDRLTGARTSYATTFPTTENPISEGGRWINGAANGVDWTDWRSTAGLGAWGTQTASVPPYQDSWALLRPVAGQPWGANQDARGTIFIRNRGSWTGNHEVELLFRGHGAPNVIRCYEVLFSVTSSNPYIEIVQWHGPLAVNPGGAAGNPLSFTSFQFANDGIVLNDGDRVRATIIGDQIRMYRQQGAATTWTEYSISHNISGDPQKFRGGNPGIGWWKNGTSNNDDYGFSAWSVETWD